jgi:hypothetical protein
MFTTIALLRWTYNWLKIISNVYWAAFFKNNRGCINYEKTHDKIYVTIQARSMALCISGRKTSKPLFFSVFLPENIDFLGVFGLLSTPASHLACLLCKHIFPFFLKAYFHEISHMRFLGNHILKASTVYKLYAGPIAKTDGFPFVLEQ